MDLYQKRTMKGANDCNIGVVDSSYVPIKKNGISITMVE